jgi:NADH:ubiquinone oxidoreductase subunit 3 (subunit A)
MIVVLEMISIVFCVLIYYLGSLFVNYVFSVNLCGFASLVSSNFECGFVSALSTYIRFRFSYWLVICNFIIFELELLISFVFIYSIASYCIYLVVIGLLLLLLFDLYLD